MNPFHHNVWYIDDDFEIESTAHASKYKSKRNRINPDIVRWKENIKQNKSRSTQFFKNIKTFSENILVYSKKKSQI